nr:hypothetical protein B0A51_08705 [Rachicladosporium sp. CCFEE 5018]
MPPPLKKQKLSSSKNPSKTSQPSEILFNPTARQDYLTGFHKRKVARADRARELAQKKDKEEKVLARKQLREQRKEDLSQHVAEFQRELQRMNEDVEKAASEAGENSDAGADEAEVEVQDVTAQESEYVDEDKYTTVTVSAMDDTPTDDELDASAARKAAEAKLKAETDAKELEERRKKRPWLKEKPDDGKPKAKKKKFRYESKHERRETRNKQKAKNSKQAAARKGEKGEKGDRK